MAMPIDIQKQNKKQQKTDPHCHSLLQDIYILHRFSVHGPNTFEITKEKPLWNERSNNVCYIE